MKSFLSEHEAFSVYHPCRNVVQVFLEVNFGGARTKYLFLFGTLKMLSKETYLESNGALVPEKQLFSLWKISHTGFRH